VSLVIFLLSQTPLVQTTQFHGLYPHGGLIPDHLLFNIKTIGAAGRYNEKPLTATGIFAPATVNPISPTTSVRPDRKYKRVVCPPGFTRAGDIIPGLDSVVPTAIHDVAGPSVEHVTATDTGGGTMPIYAASQSNPTPNPPASGASPQAGAHGTSSIPSVEHVAETPIVGDPPSLSSIPPGSPPVTPSASPPALPASPASSFPVFPTTQEPSIKTPPSGVEFGLSNLAVTVASSPFSDPSAPADFAGPAFSSPIIPTGGIQNPPGDIIPAGSTPIPSGPSSVPVKAFLPPAASAPTIIPSSAPSSVYNRNDPIVESLSAQGPALSAQTPSGPSSVPVAPAPATQGPPLSTQTPDPPSSVPVAPAPATQGPALSTQTPDGPSSVHNLAEPIPVSDPGTTTLIPGTTDTPNGVPNQNTITPTTPVTPIATPPDIPSAVPVISSVISPDPPIETTTPNQPSNLQVTEGLEIPASTADSSPPPSPPRFFVRQAITDPDACIPIPDDTPTGASTNGAAFLGSALLPSAITQNPPAPIGTQITFTTSESGTLVTGVTNVATIPGVQEIQPVPITTQVTLTTSISGKLQTVVTLVTTTPLPVPIDPPQATTTLITFTTSISGTLQTVVTLLTTTPSLTNPTTESITYVTLISGIPETKVTVLTEEAFVGVATATAMTTPFSEITILLDWPVTTTTSHSGFGGSFSTYRDGIKFWIGIMYGFIIVGVWF
jgi:hypothetical protein